MHIVGKSLLLIIFLFSIEVRSEIFSAINELEKLVVKEKIIIDQLEILASQINHEYIERKLKSWRDEFDFMRVNVTRYITNPLNAFLLIKRATSDIALIRKFFFRQSEKFFKNVKNLLPSDEDLSGAVDGLLRLQVVYKLQSEDFANGIIDGQKTRPALSAHDVFVIGEEAFKLENRDFFATKYFTLAWELVKRGQDQDKEIDEENLLLHLATCYNKVGDYVNEIAVVNALIELNPDDKKFQDFKQSLENDLEKNGNKKLTIEDPYAEEYEINGEMSLVKEKILYSQVCRGSIAKSSEELSKLQCRFVSNSFFSKIAPFKVEEANLDPYIVLFIDILSDDEIEFLKNISKPIFERAFVGWDDDSKIQDKRVAQLAWHFDDEHKILMRIAKRVEDMTGLAQEEAEAIQVQNYGIGGHYVPHWDHRVATDPPFEGPGNRIATALFYLTDVESGGATVFPYIKVKILARKAAVAFWYNLRASGQGDYLTKHAGCPVLLGSKWVANRWIREHGQEFRRPCVPEEFVETFEESYYQDWF